MKRPTQGGPFHLLASPRGLFASCGYSPVKGPLGCFAACAFTRPQAGSGRTAFVRFAHKRVLSRLENPIIKKPDPYGPGLFIMASPRGLTRCLRQLALRAASLRSTVCRETTFRSVRTGGSTSNQLSR